MTIEQIEYRRSDKDAMHIEFRLDSDTSSGTFGGHLNLWQRRDSYDTEWFPKAWSRAGLDIANPLQDMHSTVSFTRDTLGMFSAVEDDRGLAIAKDRGVFAPTQPGQDARALAHLAQEFGQPVELSVGFKRVLTADQDPTVDSDDPNIFTVTKLVEASLIIPHFASQPGAALTSVRAQADALRAVTDSADLLDPKTEARIIDMMTDANGRKRNLVIRVGWEDQRSDDEKQETPEDVPEEEHVLTEESPSTGVEPEQPKEFDADEAENGETPAEEEESKVDERAVALQERLIAKRLQGA